MYRIVFTPEAEAELTDALDWYATNAPLAVPQLRAALKSLALRLRESPLAFPAGPRDTRRARVHRFPYILIYRVGADAVNVIAFFHTSRNPTRWHDRI